MSQSGTTFPASIYEGLLLKLVAIMELAQKAEGTQTAQSKQALLQATNDFKDTINRAKDVANGLPGGEILVEEQDEIIEMLEQMRADKRRQLSEFSNRVVTTGAVQDVEDVKMEADSTASTPGQ